MSQLSLLEEAGGGLAFQAYGDKDCYWNFLKIFDQAWLDGNKQNPMCHELEWTLLFLKGREESPDEAWLGWWGWMQISGQGSACDGNTYTIRKEAPQKQWIF